MRWGTEWIQRAEATSGKGNKEAQPLGPVDARGSSLGHYALPLWLYQLQCEAGALWSAAQCWAITRESFQPQFKKPRTNAVSVWGYDGTLEPHGD